MKSAWELALERTGGGQKPLTDGQRQALTEINTRCKAKLAEIDIVYSDKLKKATSREEADQILADKQVESASVQNQFEREKDKIRNS
jgi:hypothetical protein